MRRYECTEEQINYDVYKMNAKEYIKYTVIIFAAAGIMAYIFYRNFFALIIFLLPMVFYIKIVKRYLVKKRKKELTLQFKEFCFSLCSQFMAGYSFENAVKESYREMVQMYGKNAYICKELLVIIAKLNINMVIEKCFEEFASRSNIEEIGLFAEIIKLAKRSGGDLIEIIRNAADSISQKIEAEREIKTIINAKKYEQMVMNVVPVFIVLYVNFTSPDMMEIMYKTIVGKLVMTICLIFYIIAFYLGVKITDIEM